MGRGGQRWTMNMIFAIKQKFEIGNELGGEEGKSNDG